MKELQLALASAGIDTATLRPALGEGAGTIYCLTSCGRRAMELWESLRQLVPATRRWPVLLGATDELEMIAENMADGTEAAQTAELLRRAEELAKDPDPRAWFYRSIGKEVPPDDVTFGPWVAGRPQHAIMTPYAFGGAPRPLAAVEVGLVPSEVCWHAPIHLRFGSFNECPACEEHAAMQKHWLEKYEAEAVAITHDVIELRVGKPPATRDEARALARQQYSYCTDIVSQGCGTVEALAAQLYRGKAWYFWWD